MANRSLRKRRFRSVSIYWLLPNMLTIGGFVSGLTALRFALDGRWAGVIVLITVAAVFDALDGRTARRFKTQSAFGAALDSLSDLVVFGVVPALCLLPGHFRIQVILRGWQRCFLPCQLLCGWRGSIQNCQTHLIMQPIILPAYQRQPQVFWC